MQRANTNNQAELVFLGTSAPIQSPAFFCECKTCEQVRRNPALRRTRASVALLGEEIVLIDASPDLELQLERESLRHVDRIFLTHWHYDHAWGLAGLAEPSGCARWKPVDLYLPHEAADQFNQQLGFLKDTVFHLNPIQPGDVIKIPDATWEVVKTTHTSDSVGFIVQASTRFAYLVDGIRPPGHTLERLTRLDLLILEATMDELDASWQSFSLDEAVAFWRETGIKNGILTHLSCHGWRAGQLVSGLTCSQRQSFETEHPGLTFAHDGLRVVV